jgi:hypothetical protein
MPNFDEAVLQQPDGTTQRLSATEFFKVPLQDRVKLLWQRKVLFYVAGREVSPTVALK